jgi:hypothetical protein
MLRAPLRRSLVRLARAAGQNTSTRLRRRLGSTRRCRSGDPARIDMGHLTQPRHERAGTSSWGCDHAQEGEPGRRARRSVEWGGRRRRAQAGTCSSERRGWTLLFQPSRKSKVELTATGRRARVDNPVRTEQGPRPVSARNDHEIEVSRRIQDPPAGPCPGSWILSSRKTAAAELPAFRLTSLRPGRSITMTHRLQIITPTARATSSDTCRRHARTGRRRGEITLTSRTSCCCGRTEPKLTGACQRHPD